MNMISQEWRHPWGVVADLLRLVALVSVPVAAFTQPVEGVVRFAGVFAVLLVSRSRVPRGLDAAWAATLLVSAWASALQWYMTYRWIDIPIHFATTGATAGVAYFLLLRTGVLPRHPGDVVRNVVVVTMIGSTLSVLWEMYEWSAEQFIPNEILVGYSDTIGDQAMGTLGSVLAGVVIARWLPGVRQEDPSGRLAASSPR